MKVRELKRLLVANRATWTVSSKLNDEQELPDFPTGGADPAVPAGGVPPTDLRKVLARRTNNPRLLRRRIARGFIASDEAARLSTDMPEPDYDTEGPADPADGTTATSSMPTSGSGQLIVDWRNRWGASWVTTVREQSPCNACWAFSSTALVESMVRIEHKLWCWRSEGDPHGGMTLLGAEYDCDDAGNPDFTLDWIQDNGIADPACFSWEQEKNGADYKPTSDRPGRVVRIPDYEWLTLDNDGLEVWLDTVGPFIIRMKIYADFKAYGSGVYRHDYAGSNEYSAHYMLVVGYNATQGYWIVKNSWGSDWGDMGGYAYIAYGECGMDDLTYCPYKWGLPTADPDPWTRRRQHGGNIIENVELVNGERRDRFIMLAQAGAQLRHWWRENWAHGLPWSSAPTLVGTDVASAPTLTATTYGGNYECVYLTTGKRLHHRFFNQASKNWQDGGVFGPTDAAGVPGLLQSSYSAPGYFELVVRTADSKLNFWYRLNKSPWTWSDGGRFGSNVAHSGPALVQHSNGNLELVCALADGRMQHWYRDGIGGAWKILNTFGGEVKSPPCMLIGQTNAADEQKIGNYELCVAVSGKVQHWSRDVLKGTGFTYSSTFGHDIAQVVGLLQASFSFNLEVIVLRIDKKIQHYWKDGSGWHEGVVIGYA